VSEERENLSLVQLDAFYPPFIFTSKKVGSKKIEKPLLELKERNLDRNKGLDFHMEKDVLALSAGALLLEVFVLALVVAADEAVASSLERSDGSGSSFMRS